MKRIHIYFPGSPLLPMCVCEDKTPEWARAERLCFCEPPVQFRC